LNWDWHLIFRGLAAVGTLIVAVLAIWGDWFRNILAGPDLIIMPHNFRGNITTLNFRREGDVTISSVRAIYYHLKVVNNKKWVTAKNCRVVITDIHKKGPDGNFHRLPLVVPLQLVWTPAELAPVLQTFGDQEICDFGRLIEGDVAFYPTLYAIPNNFLGSVGVNEAVRYTLNIKAENFISTKVWVVEVSWDGTFSDNMDIMERSLIVKNI
jgi:hypothetical protein